MMNIHVSGMTCEHCSSKVTQALKNIDGVDEVTVDLASGTVDIDHSQDIAAEDIKAAVEGAGFSLG